MFTPRSGRTPSSREPGAAGCASSKCDSIAVVGICGSGARDGTVEANDKFDLVPLRKPEPVAG
jgi:hypothetical protein